MIELPMSQLLSVSKPLRLVEMLHRLTAWHGYLVIEIIVLFESILMTGGWLRTIFFVAILGAIGAWRASIVAADEPAKDKVKLTFEEHVLPILKSKCVRCHAGSEPENGLRLTTRREILRGGTSGPAIRIAAAESSLLWEKLASNQMPKGGPALSADEKGIIRSWINEGAVSNDPTSDEDLSKDDTTSVAPEHWAFRPPVRPKIPAVRQLESVQNPIDSFIVAALEEKGLTLSAEANREALLRRVTFDLIGLPPAPDEIQAFVADDDESAYERLIERLLDSPQYGERWGRHWLDVAGYADSAGVLSEDRPLQSAFRYRDYVIRAFNSDKGYDQFLREQIAGDELSDYWSAFETFDRLPDNVVEAVTATGYLRCAADSSRPDFSTIKNADALYYYPTINDTLQIVASSTMGLTLQCARCHSHKFDPIPQTEYYRLQAIFMAAFRPRQWIPQMERRILIASAAQKRVADERNAQVDAEVARLKKEQADLKSQYKQRLFDERLVQAPEQIRDDLKLAFGKNADQRTVIEKYLVEKFQSHLQPDDKQLDKLLPETFADYRSGVDRTNAAIGAQDRRRMYFDEIRALYDLPGPVSTPLLRRGDALTPGPPVEPGVLSSLATPVAFEWTPPGPEAKTTGRRMAFARWLTQPDHPLTARVIVNRIWLNHFGEGIVSTPEDFGTLGSAPSHPLLFDWLAREFVDSGWSIKHLHRLIMMSSAYRQKSALDESHSLAKRIDPDNRLLWRQRMRRVDAESLRDAMLYVADLLDSRQLGYPVPVARRPDGDVTVADGQNPYRRSIYVQVLRGNPLTLLHAHDQPVMETNCTRRSRSTVSTQALTLLNSDTCIGYAQAFAERLLRESYDGRVVQAARIAWSRNPTPEEIKAFNDFLATQQLRYSELGEGPDSAERKAVADLCHMLLASNEFVYVD